MIPGISYALDRSTMPMPRGGNGRGRSFRGVTKDGGVGQTEAGAGGGCGTPSRGTGTREYRYLVFREGRIDITYICTSTLHPF